MPNSHQEQNGASGAIPGARRVRNLVLWAVCVIAWFLLDRATKAYFNGFDVGEVVVPSIAGVVRFQLVHNFGVAWSAFSGAVGAISVFTAILCIAIAAFSLHWSRTARPLDMLALGLLLAGGLGNLFDRLAYGYVVDFISPLFIDFPTFNVADIGVTCGIALLMVSLVVQMVQDARSDAGCAQSGKE